MLHIYCAVNYFLGICDKFAKVKAATSPSLPDSNISNGVQANTYVLKYLVSLLYGYSIYSNYCYANICL